MDNILKIFSANVKKELQSVDDRQWTRIFDWTSGAWQANSPYDQQKSVLAYPTVFACQTLITNDISKLKIIIQKMNNGVWELSGHPLTKLLRKPNGYQNSIQFLAAWISSKLSHGNTYIFKTTDLFGNKELHILDPLKVYPLISDSGEVFYRLNEDRLTRLEEGQIVVPATEIIHDRFNCLFHPLIGLSPIFAAATAANTGLTNQNNMDKFFANNSNPGGILSAPGAISDQTANRLKEYWSSNFKGDKAGQVAIAGDGLKFEPMRMSNVDAQVIELLGWNDEKICSCYHVPAYMVGVGSMPSYDNIEALIQSYYSQCLQILIESIEMSLDDGLEIPERHRFQIDIDAGLFRMDSETLMKTLGEGVSKGIVAPNEGRQKLNYPSVTGGDLPYLQQQNYSLEALAKRDAQNPLGAEDTTVQDLEQALALFDTMTKNVNLH